MKIDDLIDEFTQNNMRKYADVEENDHTGLQFYLMSPSPAANHHFRGQVPTLPVSGLNTRNGTAV